MNNWNGIGNLGNDPEIEYKEYTKDGEDKAFAVARFSIAVKEGKDKTYWIRMEAYGKTAEIIAEYVKKGHKIGITGKLKVDQWEKDGQKKSKMVVVVENFDFLMPKED